MNVSAHCPGSRKTAAIDALSQTPSQNEPLSRAISHRREVDSFERAQKNKLLRLRDALVDSISGVAPPELHARANGSETPTSVGDWADAGSDASHDFAISAPAEAQRTRLIDAACKAFLINRGLDPDADCGQRIASGT